ncbi:beta-class carbonic anhydrase [Catenulispora sp. MAP5-51]|uniref:beta-class carbonic anhydrase n=1 Tax=Catenulispora sp. MAP5-51 TaxID=3156298 RepID=UPI003514AF9B
MASLLENNDWASHTYTPVPLGVPSARVIVVTCLDHRLDPARILGLEPGDAPVIRNAGGRVTESVVTDIAYLGFLARQVFGVEGPLFEIAVIHHTQCGTGFLADPGFRDRAADATGIPVRTLAATKVDDPAATVKQDVERLLASPLLPPGTSVSGHVYDVDTGRVSVVLETATGR